MYLTNNSSRSATEYVTRLKEIGIWEDGDAVYTSGNATETYVKAHYPNASVYLVGTPSLQDEFRAHGIALTEDKPDLVVLSYDTTLDYDKLCRITYALVKGADFVATHPDVNCPARDVSKPDVGSILKLIEASTGRTPSVICGKPYRYMADGIAALLRTDPSRLMMVGDRLNTDIAFGNDNGMHSLLVFTGETSPALYATSEIKATFTLPSLNDIVTLLD